MVVTYDPTHMTISVPLLRLFSPTSGYSCTDQEQGIFTCPLDVVHDVLLESATTNYDYLGYLIIARHPSYPLKRSLLQFENLQASSSWTVRNAGCILVKIGIYYDDRVS